MIWSESSKCTNTAIIKWTRPLNGSKSSQKGASEIHRVESVHQAAANELMNQATQSGKHGANPTFHCSAYLREIVQNILDLQ